MTNSISAIEQLPPDDSLPTPELKMLKITLSAVFEWLDTQDKFFDMIDLNARSKPLPEPSEENYDHYN